MEDNRGFKRSPYDRSWTGWKGGGKGTGGAGDSDDKVCYYSQKPAYIAKDCPEKVAQATAKAAAKTRARPAIKTDPTKDGTRGA